MTRRTAAAGLLHRIAVEPLSAVQAPVALWVARDSLFCRQAAEKVAASDRT
jgi:hypothetical protein